MPLWLLTAVARMGVPQRFQKLAAIALALVAALALCGAVAGIYAHWLHGREKAAVQADRNASNAAAVSTARQADEQAHAASTGQLQAIQQENDHARAAAATDDDPLAAGLRSLRADASGRARPSTR